MIWIWFGVAVCCSFTAGFFTCSLMVSAQRADQAMTAWTVPPAGPRRAA